MKLFGETEAAFQEDTVRQVFMGSFGALSRRERVHIKLIPGALGV